MAPPQQTPPPAESEAPAWYIRPAAGGMFGPADDTVIHQWVAEGRVGADSHVWRTGWPEWRLARDVPEHFPQLAGPVAPAAAVELPMGYNEPQPVEAATPTDPHDPSVVAARYQRRKKQAAATQQLAAVLLGVLVVILAIVLVWVVMRSWGSDTPKQEETPSVEVTAPDSDTKTEEPATSDEAAETDDQADA